VGIWIRSNTGKFSLYTAIGNATQLTWYFRLQLYKQVRALYNPQYISIVNHWKPFLYT